MPFVLPPVYPVLDTLSLGRAGLDPVEASRALLEGGAEILQFRHKPFWSAETFEQAAEVGRLCKEAGAVFIVNDRADYAALLGAGLHVGQEDLAPSDARRVIGPEAVLGFSTHNPDQMRRAACEPVDYVAFGPVFPTASKERPDPVTGLDALREVRRLTRKPLVAIGGITTAHAGLCFEAGADSLAVIGGLFALPCDLRVLRNRMPEWLRLADRKPALEKGM